MAVFEVVEGDITRLAVDAIVTLPIHRVVGRWRRGRYDTRRRGQRAAGRVPHFKRLPHRRSQNNQRLPFACAFGHSYGRAGMVWRKTK